MTRYAFCHFCDDVRVEIGFKTSIMGLYGGDLLVPANPTVLPKLCIVAFAITDTDHPFHSLIVRISEGDRVLIDNPIPSETLAGIQRDIQARTDAEDTTSRISIGTNLFISPFVVDRNMTIKTMVIADGEEMVAGRLHVKFASATRTR
jgi:hypothetical protein